MKITTHNNLTCLFTERNHRYTIKETGQVLTSGTKFIKQFFPKFDAPKVAAEVAKKRGVKPEELLKEWAKNGQQAAEEGTAVHKYAEHLFNREKPRPKVDYSERVQNMINMVIDVDTMLWKKGFKKIAAEQIIFSPSLNIAGQVDLIMETPSGEIIIIDWKTNKELTLSNPFQSGLEPITHLEDANLIHYTLQLSLYQYIMELEEYFPEDTQFKRLIIHIQEDKSVPYYCKYLKDEIEAMLI